MLAQDQTKLFKQNHLVTRQALENYYVVIGANYVCRQFVSLSHHNNKYLDISVFFIIVKLELKQEKLSNYRVGFHCPACPIIPRQGPLEVISIR